MLMLLQIGHTAPMQMANAMIHTDTLPMHLAHTLFHISDYHAGQERSTRYQLGFTDEPLHSLKCYLPTNIEGIEGFEERYQTIGKLAIEKVNKQFTNIQEELQKHYDVPNTEKAQNTLQSRSLDSARQLLLMGQTTGQSFQASAQEWSRLIGYLNGSSQPLHQRYASQIKKLLSPPPEIMDEKEGFGYTGDTPDLIRRADPNTLNIDNTQELRTFLQVHPDILGELKPRLSFLERQIQKVKFIGHEVSEDDKIITQYFLTIHPSLDYTQLSRHISTVDENLKVEMVDILLNDVGRRNNLLNMAATSGMTLEFQNQASINRDLNRHRGGAGRFINLPMYYGLPCDFNMAMEIMSRGYILPQHLIELAEVNPRIKEILVDFERDFQELYLEHIYPLLNDMKTQYEEKIDYGFILNLLPLGHNVPLIMHLDIKQLIYLYDLRVQPGGDEAYRVLVWEAINEVAKNGSIFAKRFIRNHTRPNLDTQKGFLDRT